MGLREYLLDSAVDFLFPPACPACGSPGSAPFACPDCRASLRRVREGEPDFEAARARLREGRVVDDCTVLWYFERDGPLQALLHLVKYSGRTSLGRLMGEELGGMAAVRAGQFDMLVPVPLHPVKLRERGYNQSLVIASGAAAQAGRPVCPEVLERTRYTASQTRLSPAGRAQNVAGAFRVPPASRSRLGGKRVLLVDDVLTTGSTLRECALALREAGVSGVQAAAVALAGGEAQPGAIS
jgi:ComF family protein